MFQSSATSKPLVYLLPPESRWDPDGCVNNSGLTSDAICKFFRRMVVAQNSSVMNVDRVNFYVKGGAMFTAGQIKKMHPIILADDATLGRQVIDEVMGVKASLCIQRPEFKVDMFSTTGSHGFKLAEKESILEVIRSAKDGVIFYGAFHTHTRAFYAADDDFYIPVHDDVISESELKEALKGVGGIFAADTCHALAYESTRGGGPRFYLREKPDSFRSLGSGLGLELPLGCLGKTTTLFEPMLALRPMSSAVSEAVTAKLQYRAQDEAKLHLHPVPPAGPAHSKQDAEVEELRGKLADLQERHDGLNRTHSETLVTLGSAQRMLNEKAASFEIEKQALSDKHEMDMDRLRREHVQEMDRMQTTFADKHEPVICELENLRIEHGEQKLAFKDNMEQQRLEHQAVIDGMRDSHAGEIEKLRAENAEILHENVLLKREHEYSCVELEAARFFKNMFSEENAQLRATLDQRPEIPSLLKSLTDSTLTIDRLENKLRDTQSRLDRALEFQASAMDYVEKSFAMTEEALLSTHGARQGFACLDHACARLTQVSLGSQASMAEAIQFGFRGVQATLQVVHGAHLDAARGFMMRGAAGIFGSEPSFDPEVDSLKSENVYPDDKSGEGSIDLDDEDLKRLVAAKADASAVASLSGVSLCRAS